MNSTQAARQIRASCSPVSTTRRQLNTEELAPTGFGEYTVRLSIGIEHIDAMLAVTEQAPAAAK